MAPSPQYKSCVPINWNFFPHSHHFGMRYTERQHKDVCVTLIQYPSGLSFRPRRGDMYIVLLFYVQIVYSHFT